MQCINNNALFMPFRLSYVLALGGATSSSYLSLEYVESSYPVDSGPGP